MAVWAKDKKKVSQVQPQLIITEDMLALLTCMHKGTPVPDSLANTWQDMRQELLQKGFLYLNREEGLNYYTLSPKGLSILSDAQRL